MNIRQLFVTLRYKLRYGSTVEWYNFWYMVLRRKQQIIPEVASIDDTIAHIVKNKSSVSRFGDGEMLLTECRAIGFQKGDPALASRLIEVLTSNEPGHLVCISDAFTDLYRYNRKARRFWRTHFYLYGRLWDKYLNPDKTYYNTFVTRPYMDFASKERCMGWFTAMKEIWKDRDVVFIEGEKAAWASATIFLTMPAASAASSVRHRMHSTPTKRSSPKPKSWRKRRSYSLPWDLPPP